MTEERRLRHTALVLRLKELRAARHRLAAKMTRIDERVADLEHEIRQLELTEA